MIPSGACRRGHTRRTATMVPRIDRRRAGGFDVDGPPMMVMLAREHAPDGLTENRIDAS